jgi:hypothetical protein
MGELRTWMHCFLILLQIQRSSKLEMASGLCCPPPPRPPPPRKHMHAVGMVHALPTI